MEKGKYKNINDEFDYVNIQFTTSIEDIIEILSSDKEYEFYFNFTEFFDKGCLVQLERLEESNKIVSEWNEDYYDEFEWDEPKERGVGGVEDSFDNTNEFHEVSDVECVTLYRAESNGFRESFLNLIKKYEDNDLYDLGELIDLTVDEERGQCDPGDYEYGFLDEIENQSYECLLNQQYLTGYYSNPSGYKITWLRYVQGNFGGETFEFGYIEK